LSIARRLLPLLTRLAGVTEQPDAAWRRPDPGLLRLRRRLTVLLVTVPAALACLVLLLLAGPAEAAAGAVVSAVLTGLVLIAVERRYAAWGYLEREDDLLVCRGVLVRRTSVVPYGRMQHVDVTAGPLARRFGLAMVTMHTAAAATDASVPGLLAEEASRLRDRLAALGEARQAGV
jgi:membrane protein YdbS with pleckstrin-like domain